MCRHDRKKVYRTRELAEAGAEEIRHRVEAIGDTYTQLYPYQCADDVHWHLSHYEQSERVCPACEATATAWSPDNGATSWIMSAHPDAYGRPCAGEGQVVREMTNSG